jgi:hypothetical protein
MDMNVEKILKATIPNADYERSNTVRECGILG